MTYFFEKFFFRINFEILSSKMKMQLHQYPSGHQVDGLPPVLSDGNVGKCTSAWTRRWLLPGAFFSLTMMVFEKKMIVGEKRLF